MHTIRCLRIFNLKIFSLLAAGSLVFTVMIVWLSEDPSHHSLNAQKPHIAVSNQHLGVRGKMAQDSLAALALKESTNLHAKHDTRPPLLSPRIVKYCNPPSSEDLGQEGLVPKDYKLLNVHILIRHGDRSPAKSLPDRKNRGLSCLVDTERYSHVPKLQNFPQVISQFSEKEPKDPFFNRWSLLPSRTLCADGQLTGLGAIQQVLNGMHYSERYVHFHGLLDETNWPQRVLAKTTKISRTFQSAIAFLYGLLPTFDLEKLNLQGSQTTHFCDEKVFGPACSCPGADSYRRLATDQCRMEKNYTVLLKRYNNETVPLLHNVLGYSEKAMPKPTVLMDSLTDFACHNVPPPCTANGQCVSTSTIEQIWEPIDYMSKCLHRNLNYKKFALAHMYGLLHTINQEFKRAIDNEAGATFHLYSGHDITVSPLITALDLSDSVWPGFASRIVFELYQRTGTRKFYLRILQNGKVVTSEATFCRNRTSEGLCDVTFFSNFVSSINYIDICNSKAPRGNSKKTDTRTPVKSKQLGDIMKV